MIPSGGHRRRLAPLAVLVAGLVIHLLGTALHHTSDEASYAGVGPISGHPVVADAMQATHAIASAAQPAQTASVVSAAGEHHDDG